MKTKTKFKQIEVGMIPEDWESKILGDVCWVKNGKTNSQDAVENGIFPLFDRSPDVKKSDKYLFDCEAVIIPGEGREFLPRYYKGKFDLHQRAYAISSLQKEKIYLKFIYYWIKEKRDYLARIAVGSTVRSLRLKHLTDFPLGLPSVVEQQFIAEIFSDLDSKIELNLQMNETLEALSKTIFDQWFVNFEFPNEVGNPYKSNNGKMIISELGSSIPEGWNVKTLENIADAVKGFSYTGKEKDNADGDYVFITLNNIVEGGGFKPKFSWISSNRLKERHFLSEMELIIANTHFGVGGSNIARLLGCPALVFFPYDYTKETGVFSHHITTIIPFNPELKYFLYFFLKMIHKETASIYRTGTSVAGLDMDNFMKKCSIIEPPKSILKKFNSIAEPLLIKLTLNYKENTVLTYLRNSLLPRLMSGKIRVPVEVK